jgi:tetratricopeptide (TPR) repeat protein
VYQVQGNLEKALEYRNYAAGIREKLCTLNPNATYIRSSWAVSLNGVGATFREMGRIEEAIAIHRQALEQHKQVAAGDALQAVARVRLVDGIVQLARAHSAGEMFEEAVEDIDSIDGFTQPEDSYPLFAQGREYAIIASKIGALQSDAVDESLENLMVQCIEQSKFAFTKCAELGYDVVKGMEGDTAFKNFTVYPQCAEVQAFVIEQFGPDESAD